MTSLLLRVNSLKIGSSQMAVRKPIMLLLMCLPPRNCSSSPANAAACQYGCSFPSTIASTLLFAMKSIKASLVLDSGATGTFSHIRTRFLATFSAVDLRIPGPPTSIIYILGCIVNSPCGIETFFPSKADIAERADHAW